MHFLQRFHLQDHPRRYPAVLWLTVLHLARQIWHTPLLLLYVLAGITSGLIYGGLCKALVNYALLAIYALIIRLWTLADPPPKKNGPQAAQNNPKSFCRDILLIIIAACVVGTNALLYWGYFGTRFNFPIAIQQWTRATLTAAGWNHSLATIAANGVSNMLFDFLPLLAIALAMGYRPRHIGLMPRRLGLGIFLVLVGVMCAGLVKLAGGNAMPLWDSRRSVPLVLASYALMIFVNGLPEEFIFRGLMLSRLLPWLKKPGNALVITSILFIYSHVPSLLLTLPPSIPHWLILVGLWLTPTPIPTGLVWAYLYYRTRSIWPGVIWHASFTTLGLLFF